MDPRAVARMVWPGQRDQAVIKARSFQPHPCPALVGGENSQGLTQFKHVVSDDSITPVGRNLGKNSGRGDSGSFLVGDHMFFVCLFVLGEATLG